jgi:hypothetical protein
MTQLSVLLALAASIAVLADRLGPGSLSGWPVILGVVVWCAAAVEALRARLGGR